MKQSLKIISAVSALAAISAIIGGCSSEPKEPYSTAPLSEIREQGASLPEFANLNLSETAIYIPVVDNVRGFSFLPEELTFSVVSKPKHLALSTSPKRAKHFHTTKSAEMKKTTAIL